MSAFDTPPLPSTSWDILITGSGIKHSLLAVALSRASKSVLQTDTNPYYGGSSTAFYNFSEAHTWASAVNAGLHSGFSDATAVWPGAEADAAAGGGRAGRGCIISLSPHLVYWDSKILAVLRGAEMTEAFSWQAVGSWWVWGTDEEVEAGAGGAGGLTVGEVGVKAVKMVSAVKRRGGWNKGRRGAAEPTVEQAVEQAGESTAARPTTLRRVGNLREVPCTFEDVAWSPTLTDRDRSNLGGLLRYITSPPSLQADPTVTLSDFVTQTYPLPPLAITSLSALTLLPTPPAETKLADALPLLRSHMASLGSIPDVREAAALTLAYGGGAEMCQVFSRAAAVAGGVNVLGRGVARVYPTLVKEEGGEERKEGERRWGVELDNGEVIGVDWIIGEDAEIPSSLSASIPTPLPPPATSTLPSKIAHAVYVISAPLTPLFEKKYTDESIPPASTLIMFPVCPTAPEQIYILARSTITSECPRGQCVLYASTPVTTGEKAGGAYEAMRGAVDKVLAGCGEEDAEVLFTLTYTTTTTNTEQQEEQQEGILHLRPLSPGWRFEDAWVDEARGVFERAVGGGWEGEFMAVPEGARRAREEEEEV